jgi:hypothetical protein
MESSPARHSAILRTLEYVLSQALWVDLLLHQEWTAQATYSSVAQCFPFRGRTGFLLAADVALGRKVTS